MQERIRRTLVLLKELDCEVSDEETDGDSYNANFTDESGFGGSISVERESKFVEFSFSISFPRALQDFLRDRIDDFMQICYQYGCYNVIVTSEDEIAISVFSKLYFAGLQYYALKETLKDMRSAADDLQILFDLRSTTTEGEADGYT